jgi:hypothetical protein
VAVCIRDKSCNIEAHVSAFSLRKPFEWPDQDAERKGEEIRQMTSTAPEKHYTHPSGGNVTWICVYTEVIVPENEDAANTVKYSHCDP